jgi:putative AlgH/UPF0301 family transcriptional regulator
MSDEQQPFADPVTARQLRDIQSGMLEQLKLLTSEENLERGKTIIVQQAMLIHSVDELTTTMKNVAERYETTIQRLNTAFMSLIKVPIACMVIGVASWAYMYSQVISENTWLVMMAIAAFPWLGESISAIAKMFGLGRGGTGNGGSKEK